MEKHGNNARRSLAAVTTFTAIRQAQLVPKAKRKFHLFVGADDRDSWTGDRQSARLVERRSHET